MLFQYAAIRTNIMREHSLYCGTRNYYMAHPELSERNRSSLIGTVLVICLISLVQPGCNCGSSDSVGTTPVANVFPVQGSDTALVSTNVVAFFGIEMNAASVEASFTLTESGGAEQPAAVVYDATANSAILDPVTDLTSGTEYRATISSTVEDINGNMPLSSDFVWSFTISEATELVSKDENAVAGNDVSSSAAIDGTGRFVVFESEASNLVPTFTTLNRNHIYRKDTVTDEVILVSSDAAGLEASNNSFAPRISDDGRYVVFTSAATNLSSVFTGGTLQVYIKDLEDGSIELVSSDITGTVAANNISENPDVSNDGRYVVFESAAGNLSALSNGFTQIYRKDLSDDSIEIISRNSTQSAGGGGNSNRPRMSSDAQFIVFDSNASDIVLGAGGTRHVYLVDMSNPDVTEQISVNSSEVQGNGASVSADISDDGVFVVFESIATNLASGDSDGGLSDIFRRNRTSPGDTQLVSTADNSSSGNDGSFNASISGDGNFVAFQSASTNLVSESVLGQVDIFVRDFSTAPSVTIQKINLSQAGLEAENDSSRASISSDGRYVSFDSTFNYDITDTNTVNDVYRSHNRTF